MKKRNEKENPVADNWGFGLFYIGKPECKSDWETTKKNDR